MSQEFDNNVLDLVTQKGLYPYEYVSDFKKFKEEKKINDKEYENGLKVWNKFEMKIMKDYQNLYLKCDALLLADVF